MVQCKESLIHVNVVLLHMVRWTQRLLLLFIAASLSSAAYVMEYALCAAQCNLLTMRVK